MKEKLKIDIIADVKQELKPENTQRKLEDIIAEVKHGIECLDKEIKLNNSYTILAGPTGGGKSTLANVLTGHKIEKSTVGGKQVYVVKGASPIKIGHRNESETALPNIQGSYIDCPGLGDTDSTRELQNAVFIQKVFACDKQKVLFVTEYSSIFAGKAQPFIKLLEAIDKSVEGGFIRFSKQFGLCISKVPSDEYELEVINDPIKISDMMQAELRSSTYQAGVDLVRSLEDRVFFFMKNDSNSSIETKLKGIMTKIAIGTKIPISPIISPEGELALEQMIKEVFNKIITFDTTAVNNFIRNTKDDSKINDNSTFKGIMQTLKEHEAVTKHKILKDWLPKIENANGMKELITNLKGFTEQIKEMFILVTDRLDSVEIIADIYPKSNEMAQSYKLALAKTIRPVIELEGKYVNLLDNISTMDKDWDTLNDLTTPSNWKKGAIIAGGVTAAVALGAATGGVAFIVEGVVLTAGTIVAGVALTAGAIAATYKASQTCNAYEQNHPQVMPHANELKKLYEGLPDTFAKLWANDHNVGKSEYLPDLKTTLIGHRNDDFNSEYNDII